MTPLPNIPTDNLYKFIFIAGLTLILSGIVLFTTQYNSINNNIDKLSFEVGKIEKESEFLRSDAFELDSEIEYIYKELSNLKRIPRM